MTLPRRLVSMVTCLALTAAVLGAVSTQLTPLAYDAAAVRRTAAEIQKLIADLVSGRVHPTDESGLGDLLEFIARSLAGQSDLRAVDGSVVDSVAALAGSGRMASDLLLRFGDRAVTPLVRSAANPVGLSYHRSGAMESLVELLQRPAVSGALSGETWGAVRQLAREMLKATNLNLVELAAAGSLAAASGDPALRREAEALTHPDELTARGVKPQYQLVVINKINRALRAFPIR